jgi:hypothetical protein
MARSALASAGVHVLGLTTVSWFVGVPPAPPVVERQKRSAVKAAAPENREIEQLRAVKTPPTRGEDGSGKK